MQPPDAKGGYGAWEVACVKCGHRAYQSMGSYIEAHEEGQEPPTPPASARRAPGDKAPVTLRGAESVYVDPGADRAFADDCANVTESEKTSNLTETNDRLR
jgi:hypothetical protein